MKRRQVIDVVEKESPFVKDAEWCGLADREVMIVGEPGWFLFLAHVTNPATGEMWIDLFGRVDLKGKRPRAPQHRAVRVEKLRRRGDGKVSNRKKKERTTS